MDQPWSARQGQAGRSLLVAYSQIFLKGNSLPDGNNGLATSWRTSLKEHRKAASFNGAFSVSCSFDAKTTVTYPCISTSDHRLYGWDSNTPRKVVFWHWVYHNNNYLFSCSPLFAGERCNISLSTISTNGRRGLPRPPPMLLTSLLGGSYIADLTGTVEKKH